MIGNVKGRETDKSSKSKFKAIPVTVLAGPRVTGG
jgi:hypothetical protein